MRARVHLLLRATDARVSRVFGWPRFRKQNNGEDQCSRVVARRTGISAMATANARAERGDRSVSTCGAKIADHPQLPRSAGAVPQSCGDHYKEPTRYARYRYFA